MVANRIEPTRPGGEAGKPNAPPEATHAANAAATPPGNLKAWLPLMVTAIAMPLIAYASTTWVLAPRLERAVSKWTGDTGKSPAKSGKKAAETAPGEKRVTVPLKKVLVNVAGTAGTRYLLANLSLVGVGEEFKTLINEHVDQLADLASSTLAGKTISDLEKPGIRNLIRTELITVFNNALGKSAVQEIYLIDFAIQ